MTMTEVGVAVLWLILGLWNWSLLGSTWVAAMRPAPDQVVDHYQDWGSARNYWAGLPVYTPHSTSIPRHLQLPANPVPSVEYNAHPPTSVLLALPLARLDYTNAVLAWNVISLAALTATLAIIAVKLALPWTVLPPTVALLPLCLPVLGNLQMGQLTLVLGFLVTAMWALERSGRANTVGLLLGTAAAIKLFPAYLVVYYVARHQFRPLVATLLSVMLLNLATVLVLGVETYRDYVGIVLPRLGTFQGFGYNLSIAGLWHKLFDPGAEVVLVSPLQPSLTVARWGTLISDLVVTLIVASLAYRARTPMQRDLAFGSAVTAMLLVSPVTWDITLLLLLVPISVLARSTGRLYWMPIALFVVMLIIWLPQPLLTIMATAGGRIDIASLAFILGAASVKFYALLGTFALGLVAFRAEGVNGQLHMANGGTEL
jgi:hypothetical protein